MTEDERYAKRELEESRYRWERVQRQRELIWALRTRILTSEEMDEVKDFGPYILVENQSSYRQEDIERRFNDLMLLQFKMRLVKDASVRRD